MAGVSVSTVSLVLSGKGYVSDITRTKVEKVIEKYNYHPRQSARRLPSKLTGNIGFIISDLHLYGNEVFYSRVLLGAELEARKRDYYVLLATIGQSFAPAKDTPRFIRSHDVDGIIIAGGVPYELIECVHELTIPYVLVDFHHPLIPSNLVLIENYTGAYQAVRHLIDHGYERIAFVGGSFYHSSIKERFQGYQAALNEAGLGAISEDQSLHILVDEETSDQIGYSGICTMIDQSIDFDAVVCANDTTAIGCLQALQQRTLHVPGDVALVGFDDIRHAVETEPTLTTVHVPKLEMGQQAMRLIFDLLDHPRTGQQTRMIHTELIVRESTATQVKQTEYARERPTIA
ncbi:MAG: LacI family DNA-binding transcriptional regulator [Fidelibacterota bacterium]|nr:MAG: LacI family DNA-binding transcriptional regulator [Candidatus Neomarinimicrobiota bacterium]